MAELHCIIRGRVQAVSFRAFVVSIACNLNLVGWVTNHPDGSVEVLAQGDYGVLKVFLNHLRTGSPQAQVNDIQEEWREKLSEKYNSFEILDTT